MLTTPNRRTPRVLAALLVLAIIASVFFALRTYGSLRLLQSAQLLGRPQISSVRGWMTLSYVSETYRVPMEELMNGLNLPADTAKDSSLKSLSERQGVTPFSYVSRAQQVIAGLLPPPRTFGGEPREGMMDWAATWLLRYDYPALAFILLLGAIGIPLPSGLSVVLAGSLVALGHMHWFAAAGTAIAASVIGDVILYGLGRTVGDPFLRRHGKWIGYSENRRKRLNALFARWGGVGIVLTRTLVSSLSSPVSLAAGAIGRSFTEFLSSALLGRTIWTAAYVGLGYVIAGDIEAAADFLRNLTGLLLFVVCTAVLILYLSKPEQKPTAAA
jgi:membrane-associated protein